MTAHVITIANHKGGVGKTCTAVNLSHALEILGKRVLVIDCDPQGNTSQTLCSTSLEDHTASVANLFNDKSRVFSNSYVDTNIPGVKLIPASYEMFWLERQIPDTRRVNGLRNKLDDNARRDFDVILLDTPPNIGVYQVCALTASDSYLVPVQSDSVYALSGMEVLFRSNEIIREEANPALRMLGVLLTLYDARTTMCKLMAEKIRETFPGQVFDTIINRNAALTASAVQGQTVFQSDGRSTGAKDYMSLATELLRKLERGYGQE